MSASALAHYAGISEDEFNRLLSLSAAAMYTDPSYQKLISQLDAAALSQTLPYARTVYEKYLPDIKEKYGLAGTVMSGYTLCNWVLGFLMRPERITDMLERHVNVPTQTIINALPDLAAVLDEAEQGGPDWQKALIIFSMPLMVAGN
jgi:hypothetical protein